VLDILVARALNSLECQTLIKGKRRKGRNPGKSTRAWFQELCDTQCLPTLL